MLDLQLIRNDPDAIKQAVESLGVEAPIDEILELDEKRRELLQDVEGFRHERNVSSKKIGQTDDETERQHMIDAMAGVNDRIKALESELRKVDEKLDSALYLVPNLPHESVPVSLDEADNPVIRQEGEPQSAEDFGFTPLPHWDLGPRLGIIDFERGVKLSGSRFYVLFGQGSRLQRALIQWMLDYHVREHGYTEVYPPALVRELCMWGAGQLPKFRDNIYHDAEENLWLVGTAEIPLTNLHRDEILEAGTLPKKYVSFTPCFRREKFSAGRDVRGIKRGHQFDKVEMYHFTTPECSYGELEELVSNAEDICRALEIPHRIVQMVTGDLGFTAAKKYDLELWAPGCSEWLEVSSCSNVEDFQARRANIRYRPDPDSKPAFVHTLNGSGLALPRVVISILENYQQPDGTIRIPEVLIPYMGGEETIGPVEAE